jgi:beta-phosphoglucomutase
LEIILERSDKEYSETQKVQFAAEKNELYRKLLGQMTPADVSDSVRNTLAKLREERHKIAIGSSSKNAKFILEQVALTDAFDAISDGLNITRSKPDPEVFLKAADFLGEAYDNCIVVEDAYAGIDAAKAAGMMAVGIGDAALYEKTDVAISDFEELLSLKSNLSA